MSKNVSDEWYLVQDDLPAPAVCTFGGDDERRDGDDWPVFDEVEEDEAEDALPHFGDGFGNSYSGSYGVDDRDYDGDGFADSPDEY